MDRILVHCAVAIAIGSAGACYLHHGPEEVGAARSSASGLVPVTVAAATKRDPLSLTGLGSVRALFTVGIRPQVDGRAEKAPLTEFQAHKGDVQVKTDRRLQEALDQTKAKRVPDEVQPSSAPKDLAGPRSLVDNRFQTQQRVDLQHARMDQLIAPIDADATAIEVAQRQLYPNDVGEAMAGGPAELAALSRDSSHVLSTGTLLLIASFNDQTSNAIGLKPVFASKDEELGCGDFVNARILIEIRRDVLVIPAPAIQRWPDGIFTWVAEPDNLVESARSRATTPEHLIVTSRLSEGERIVVNPQYRLRRDPRVTVKEPTASAVAKQSCSS